MKKIAMILTALIIFCVAVNVDAARKVVAVMPLENVYGRNTERVAEIMTEELMVALLKSGKYSVVERDQMATILREQGFQNIAADPGTAVEIGKLTGADYSLIGKVTMAMIEQNPAGKIADKIFGNIARAIGSDTGLDLDSARGYINDLRGRVTVDIRLVNNETGELISAKSFTGTKTGANPETALYGACQVAADNFLKSLTENLSGRIAEISGNELYIDQGIESGLQPGDTLLVLREVSPIEVNGEIVGMKTVNVGKAQVTEVNANYSICKIIATERGQTVHKGDVIKRG